MTYSVYCNDLEVEGLEHLLASGLTDEESVSFIQTYEYECAYSVCCWRVEE